MPLMVARTLTNLGDTRHALGELPLAREAWREAVAILEDFQIPGADPIRAKLDRIGEPDRGRGEPAAR